MNRFEMKLPEDMHESLRLLAFKKKSSIAEEIRKAIAEYLKKEENKVGNGTLQRTTDD
jgi:metal-responsive CopG/Arc/MetJ family transcriptional regulator